MAFRLEIAGERHMTEQELVEVLQAEILSGGRAAGEEMPVERVLAEEYSISKTAVHAALKQLESQGLIETVPRRGTFVADFRSEGNLNTALLLLKDPSRMDVRSFLELRSVLDRFALRLFCERQTIADLFDLQAVLEEGKVALSQSVEMQVDCFNDFFGILYSRSGNTILPLFYHTLASAGRTAWREFIRIYGGRRVFSLLEECLNNIRRRDADRAADGLEGAVRFYGDTLL